MEKTVLLRDISIKYPALLGKLGVNMNFGQFLVVICKKNLRESGIRSLPWGASLNNRQEERKSSLNMQHCSFHRSQRGQHPSGPMP